MEVDVSIPRLPAFVARMRTAPVVIREELTTAMHRAVILGQSESRRRVKVDIGRLRNSIATQVTSGAGEVRGVWGTNVVYARPVEEGRRAGAPMPPSGALLGWMARHGIDARLEFALRRAIGQRGIPATWFLRDALEAMKPKITGEFRAARTRIIQRLAGER